MVHKFLTREQTYAQLLDTVSENEKKLEDLRFSNDNKQEELHSLKINNQKGGEEAKDSKKKDSSEENHEIMELTREINGNQKDLDILNGRKKNIHLVCDQV